MATTEDVSDDGLPPSLPNLGAVRTMMAADRTLMAWIRTSLAMLSFGYTIYKVLQELEQAGKLLPENSTPRNAGVVLSVAGTAALVMGIVEYSGTIMLLRNYGVLRLVRPALIMAVVMAMVGVFLTFGILARAI